MRHPRVFFPPEALEALRQGNALEAIKRLRDSAGLGEARQRVDARAPGFPATPPPPDLMRALPPDAAMALARGNKIEAIKLVRHETGLSLKEARDWVEAHARSPVPVSTGLSPGEVPRDEGAWMGLVALAALIVAGLSLLV